MNVIERIKTVNADRIDLDSAVELLALGERVIETYKANQLEAPAELRDGLESLKKLVATKRTENLQAALRAAKSRRASLATAEEKRKTEDAEIERLEKLLNPGAQTAAST